VKILWGRPAINKQFRGIDLTPRMKAQNLKNVLKEKPALTGVKMVNVTFDVPTSVMTSDKEEG